MKLWGLAHPKCEEDALNGQAVRVAPALVQGSMHQQRQPPLTTAGRPLVGDCVQAQLAGMPLQQQLHLWWFALACDLQSGTWGAPVQAGPPMCREGLVACITSTSGAEASTSAFLKRPRRVGRWST